MFNLLLPISYVIVVITDAGNGLSRPQPDILTMQAVRHVHTDGQRQLQFLYEGEINSISLSFATS